MKGLNTLIRLAKFRLDEARRQLAELERLRASFTQGLEKLAAEVAREQQVAAQSVEPHNGYAAYARAAMARRGTIEKSLDDLGPMLGQAEAAVTAAFQEMKRYELAEAHHRRRAEDKARKREAAALDATALSRFQRARQVG